jgi:Domain of unknown function (DUF4168)
MIRYRVLTMMLALLGVAYAPVLLAETDAEQSAPADQSAPSESSSASYSDQELKSFAVAVLEVERIKSSYAPKLAQNLREQAQVKQAASLELLVALKQQGITVDKYQEMLASVQSNPELADKVNEYLKNAPASKGDDSSNGNGRELSSKPKNQDPNPAQKVEQL